MHNLCTVVDFIPSGSIEGKKQGEKSFFPCFLVQENHGTSGKGGSAGPKHQWDKIPGIKECG